MSPRCRRSARIASSSKKHQDSPAPQQLTSVVETDEKNEKNGKDENKEMINHSTPSSRAIKKIMSSPMPAPVTPSAGPPPKLAMTEMHPSKAHQTMAPPSSGLRNGFTDIDYNTTPMQNMLQKTPSKTPAPSSDFTFRYVRSSADHELGPDARKLMDDVREKAAKIKTELAAEHTRKMAEEREAIENRRIAAAKGKSSRFSAVHMAEFKKMDSIEGHASSFRASGGRVRPVQGPSAKPITPLKQGTKRSQSKADLDEPDSARSKTAPPRSLATSPEKKSGAAEHPPKRIRQRMEDDTSTRRPTSQDGTSIPRPKSSGNDSLRSAIPRSQTLGSLMTPTKSSLARSQSTKTSTTSFVKSPSQPDVRMVNSFSAKVGTSLVKPPSKTDTSLLARSPSKKGFSALKMWAMKNNSSDAEKSAAPTLVNTPGRFGRIKSILKRQPTGTPSQSAIPLASAPKTPGRTELTDKMFPTVPLTTPGRKHVRHVDFAPETKRDEVAQESPSPIKPSIPRPTTASKLPAPKFVAGRKAAVSQPSTTGEITYPDLSAYEADGQDAQPPAESVPSTFTFRSDHTICLDNSPSKGFGAAAGQASVRQVRQSTSASVPMPGAFPQASEASPNKENNDPLTRNGIPHGMANKKRHRASSDEEEEEDEGAKRGKKSRKITSVAEGHAVVAPRLIARASPTKQAASSAPRTPGQQRKKGGLSLSRLHMLAQPKVRK